MYIDALMKVRHLEQKVLEIPAGELDKYSWVDQASSRIFNVDQTHAI